ncbi:MAG: elongation factor G [Clostridioides sp.]|jgi:elongation factor G|nr:elongation factor G [Clostridioides sp.]
MKVYESKAIRNVAILGHSGSGKTNLIETISYTANANKIPRLTDKQNMTYNMSLIPIEYNEHKFNLLDTPGYFDFVGDVISALRVSDAAIIVIDATNPVQVGTEKSLELTENMPKIMFINKIDNEKARYKDAIQMLRDRFGNKIVPMISPVFKDNKFIKLYNVLENIDDLDEEFREQAHTIKDALMELIAETDDEILDKYFSGEELTNEEIQKGIIVGIKRGDIIPVICGSTINNIGTKEILETISEYIDPTVCDGNSFKGFVFKTLVDPFIGKMSYIKIEDGSIKKDMDFYNLRTNEKERMSGIYTVKNNNELNELKEAHCGDIIVVTKLNDLKTGDTISSDKNADELEGIAFPKPQIYYAVSPKNKNEDDKVGTTLNKFVEEDPTLTWYRNVETKQSLLGGQGELHIKTAIEKMKNKFGVDVNLDEIKVPYRETIKGSSDVQGKYKKQSGGHGQYGDVKIRFSKSDKEFDFSEELFGGSVPKQYVPAVEKGLKESMQKGILAGYPVTNIKAVLYDGSYHDVDSSEMAFKMAASVAYKKGMEEAKPIILEPIMKLKITVPDEYMGDVMGDINKRRGRILGMEPTDNSKQVIFANAPQSETTKYAIDLRSMTQGRGIFEMELEGYEEIPTHLVDKIIADASK